MIKKFQNSDIFINTIKTYPKVSIFTYFGSMYYANSAVTTDGVKLYDFLMEPQIIADQVLFFSEEFENPGWNGTYNTGSLVYPTFTGSVLLAEEFESGSWPNI
jgi:hypothetical protein